MSMIYLFVFKLLMKKGGSTRHSSLSGKCLFYFLTLFRWTGCSDWWLLLI